MSVIVRLNKDDATIYRSLRLFRVKSRLFRPFFGISPNGYYGDFFNSLLPRWLVCCRDPSKTSTIIYDIKFDNLHSHVARSMILPFYAVEAGATYVMHLIKIQRRIKAKLRERREEKLLAIAMAFHERLGVDSALAGLDPDCLMGVLGFY